MCLFASLVACKPAAGSAFPEPTPAPTRTQPTPAATEASDVVARVDGEAILEDQVASYLHYLEASHVTAGRDAVVLTLIDRIVIAKQAGLFAVKVRDDEIDAVARGIAKNNGLTMDQHHAAVTKMTWQQHRSAIGNGLLEAKLMRFYSTTTPSPENIRAQRDRVVQCLRTQAEVEVVDSSVTLPDNAYDQEIDVAGANFTGDLGLPKSQLEATVLAAAPQGPACDVLFAVEPAVLGAYLEAGYLRASASVRWPDAPQATVTLELDVHAGAQYTIGTLAFDQSAVPKAARIDNAKLQSVIKANITSGDLAAMSQIRGARVALNEMLTAAGLQPVTTSTGYRETKKGPVLDITYEIRPRRG